MTTARHPGHLLPPAEAVQVAEHAGREGETGASIPGRRSAAAVVRLGQERLWLAGALAFTLLFAARTMAPAFLDGAIQDDALQHVFWMQRYRDPELFRDDLYADYFRSLAPPGYVALYRALARAIDPLVASKLLPPLLGCVSALFTFLFVRRLHPAPAAAFLATVLLSWYVWQYDDLSSATPRAFLLPALTALLWALASGRQALGVAVTVLAALLYPLGGVLGVALLGARLVRFRRGRPSLERAWGAWLAFLAAGLLVGIALLPGLLADSPYGPTVSAAEARTMPEFGNKGRNAFFVEGAYRFWLESHRSGLNLRVTDALFPEVPVLFEYAALAALLPPVLLLRRRLTAARLVDGRAAILVQLLAASFGLFILAHLLLFRLYLPSRYVQWTIPLVLAVAAGLALAILCQEAAARAWPAHRGSLAAALALLLAGGLACYPARYDGKFIPNRYPEIAAYLRAQPKDVLVAAPLLDAAALPVLSGRRVLAAREYALAYHLGYYGQVRQRTQDLIDAYYDERPARLAELAERYGVDFFLVDRAAFEEGSFRREAAAFEPFTSAIVAKLRRTRRYALRDLARHCAVADDGRAALVPAACLEEAADGR